MCECTIASKTIVTPKGVYLPVSMVHSILAAANLLAHNNKIKFVTAVKFNYKVLEFFSFFLILLGGTIYFADDGT